LASSLDYVAPGRKDWIPIYTHKVIVGITLRPETEWVETVDVGWNALVGADHQNILQNVHNNSPPTRGKSPLIFGDGKASLHIVKYLEQFP